LSKRSKWRGLSWAEAQRTLEEKSREHQRVTSQLRWLQADQQALQDEVNASKERLENEKKQVEAIKLASKQKIDSMTDKITELTLQMTQLQSQLVEKEEAIKTIQQKLVVEEGGPLQYRIRELEGRLRTMADRLLEKDSQLDQLSSERASLRLQWELESQRAKTLDEQVRGLLERVDPDDEDLEQGKERVRPRSGPLMPLNLDQAPPTVLRAVTFLDSLSNSFGQLLRRYPIVRLGFAVYVLIIHLWVMFVLYHFTHHSTSLTKNSGISP